MTAAAGSGRWPWWGWLLLGDAIFIVVTVWGLSSAAWLLHERPALLRFQQWLDLSGEANLAVWWSAARILLAGGLFWERASTGDAALRPSWAILAVISLGLSLDEVGGLHERLARWGGWTPLFALMAVGGSALGYALTCLARRGGHGREVSLILAGYALYGSVAVQEHLEHTLDWGQWAGLRVGLEEGTELCGSLLVLLAAAGRRCDGGEPSLRVLLLRPECLRHLGVFLAAGLLAHSLVAVFVVPGLTALDSRGNPALWYPGVVYGLLACLAFRKAAGRGAPRRRAWGALAVTFLLASVGQVFDLVRLFPGVETVLPRWMFYGFYASYLFLVPPVLLLGVGAGLFRSWWPALLGVLGPPILLELCHQDWRIATLTPGFLAVVWAAGLLARPSRRVPPAGRHAGEPSAS